jgi:hypothetical protein
MAASQLRGKKLLPSSGNFYQSFSPGPLSNSFSPKTGNPNHALATILLTAELGKYVYRGG